MTHGEAVNWIINISADIAKAEHYDLWHYAQALCEIREMLEGEPERKTGKWIEDRLCTTSGGTYAVRRCSLCEAYYQDVGYGWNYCPSCGAKMEGSDED